MSKTQTLSMIAGEIEDSRTALAGIFISNAETFFPFVMPYHSLSPSVPRKDDDLHSLGLLEESLGDKFNEFRRYASFPWFQKLEDCMDGGRNIDILKKSLSDWISTMGVVGVGQYSVDRKKVAGEIARLDLEFRDPELEELKNDVTFYGEQVMGPKHDEAGPEFEGNSRFDVLGERYVYVGPPRISNFRFNTYVFSQLPKNIKDIKRLTQEIQKNAKVSKNIVPQQFQMILASEGELSYMPFGLNGPESFELRPHGVVRIDSGRLLYKPSKDSPEVDFSSMRHR